LQGSQGGTLRSEESAELTHRITVSYQLVPQVATMLEYSLRFLAGGIAVSAFAALGDTLRPKSNSVGRSLAEPDGGASTHRDRRGSSTYVPINTADRIDPPGG
jgi:hypothetical protein